MTEQSRTGQFVMTHSNDPLLHVAVQCSAVRYSTVQYSAVRYSTVQCSTVQYSTVQYSTVQYSTAQYSTVQYSAVQGYCHYEVKCSDNLRLNKVPLLGNSVVRISYRG